MKTKQEVSRQHKRVKCEKKSRISTENVNNKWKGKKVHVKVVVVSIWKKCKRRQMSWLYFIYLCLLITEIYSLDSCGE